MKANLTKQGIDFGNLNNSGINTNALNSNRENRTYEFEEYDPLYFEDGVDKFAEAGLLRRSNLL